MITPRINVYNAKKAVEFYKKVFNADLLEEFILSSGECAHAAMKFSGSIISLTDIKFSETPSENLNITLMIEVENVDETRDRIERAGGMVLTEPGDRFYGQRDFRCKDPFGIVWMPYSVIEVVPPDELSDRAQSIISL